jgi:hypothetical protein
MCKGKVNPRTGHEGSEVEQRYSSTLSLTLALDGGGWSTPPPSTHCTRDWVGPKGLPGRAQNLASHWDLIPGPSSP